MTTKRKLRNGDVEAEAFMEKLTGGPLTFGRMIRSIRLSEDMTQAECAKLLGVTKQHLSDVERDVRSVSPERAARWAEALGHAPEQFIAQAVEDVLTRAGMLYRVVCEISAEEDPAQLLTAQSPTPNSEAVWAWGQSAGRSARSGILLMQCSARAAMVRLGLTPKLAETI
jgi:transcriptional regulator with XRE-family HTH domain